MERHGSLRRVIAASEGTVSTDASIAHLGTIGEALRRVVRGELSRRPILSSYAALYDYLMHGMAHLACEEVRILYLDPRNGLICDEMAGRGTVDVAPIYPREIIRRALELGATALILAHNHTSGDPRPSSCDVDVTRRLMTAGRELGIVVHDHIIVARSGWISLRGEGLLQ